MSPQPETEPNSASQPRTSSKSSSTSRMSSNSAQVTKPSDDKSEPEPEYLHGTRLHLLVMSLLLAVLIMALDISIVSTALPRITDTFDTISDIGWYGAAFTFTNAALQPFAGKIFTFFPMKQSFVSFIAVFELGSILCAAAVSSPMFIAGRAVAGLGSSGLINGALTITASAGPPEQRPMFMGLIMAIAGAGQLVGPLIGGALTQTTSWRWCFWINLPAGAVTIIFILLIKFPSNLSRRKITLTPRKIIEDFDIIGFALFCPTIIMLMMALQWGGVTYPWSNARIIALLVASGVMLIPLCIWEYRAGSKAMFPYPLLRKRTFYSSCITGFLTGAMTLVLTYYLPLWFQTVLGANPLHSAIDTLPSFLSQLVFAIIFGILCPRLIPYLTPFALTGSTLAAIGLGLMTTFHTNTSTATWIGYQILAGAGRGLLMQVPIQTVQQHTSQGDLPIATAVVAFFQFFGGSLFLAIAQTLFGNLLGSALGVYAPGVDPSIVLDAGATNVLGLVGPNDITGVKRAYNSAITRTLYLGVAASAAGLISSLGLGWKRLEKKGDKEKKKRADEEKKGEIEETQIPVGDGVQHEAQTVEAKRDDV